MRKEQIGDVTIYLGNALEIAPKLNRNLATVVSDPPLIVIFKVNNRDRSTSYR